VLLTDGELCDSSGRVIKAPATPPGGVTPQGEVKGVGRGGGSVPRH